MVHASLVAFPLGFKQRAADGASWDGVLGSGLCFPGSLSLTGPSSVAGTAGSSLRIRCQYEKAYKGHNKYWCRGKYGTTCRKIVETEGEEKEKRNGRVSIRDHTDNLTFTVTLENLNINDTGSYWCRIQTVWILDVLSLDPSVQVEVSVSPGKSSPWSSSRAYGKRVGLRTRMGANEQCPGSCLVLCLTGVGRSLGCSQGGRQLTLQLWRGLGGIGTPHTAPPLPLQRGRDP